jgi:hypothetical protein
MPAPAPALNYLSSPVPYVEVYLPDLQLKNLYTSNSTPTISTGNLTNYGTGGTGALTFSATDGPAAYGFSASSGYARMTWTAMPTAGYVGFYRNQTSGPALGTPGASYTHSVWVRPSIDYFADRIYIEWFNGTTSIGITSYATASLVANTWQRVSVSGVMPAGADRGRMIVYTTATNGWTAASIGATLDFSSWLAEQTTDLHDYYTGNSGYARTNLAVNPSFEVDTSGWTAGSGVTVARSTAQAYTGSASALVTCAAAAFQGIAQSARIPVTAGLDYTFSAYVRDVNTAVTWRVAVVWYNALTGGTTVGSTATGAPTTISSSAWTRLSANYNVPTGATHALMYVTPTVAPTAGTQAYVDGVLFEQKAGLSAYYTGTVGSNSAPDTITIYRLVDGETSTVRNAKAVASSTAFTVNDFEAPFGKPVIYWAETSASGTSLGIGEKATTTLNVNQVWIHDPLDLSNAMAISLSGDNDATLGQGSFNSITEGYDYTRSTVLGKSRPVLQFYGQKAIEGLQFKVVTKAAGSDELADLLSVAPVLIRVPGALSNLPRLMYGVLEASQSPLDWHVNSTNPLTEWSVTYNETEPQSLDIVFTFYSYAYWQAKFSTYDGANTSYGASTYVNAVRNPPA